MPPQPKRLPLYTVFATLFLSVTGNVLASIAIPWFVLKTTGSPTQTGITAFFSLAPLVIATFFGGVIVDRVGYKRLSIVADIASGITIMLIPLLYTLGVLMFWQLLALVFLGALLDTPGYSARAAMIPELAEAAGMSLDRATSIGSLLRRATTMVGGLSAGLLIATVGEVNLLWIDAGTFFVSAAAVALFVPASMVPQPEAKDPDDGGEAKKPSYLDDLREGLRFVRGDGLIMMIIGVMTITSMVDMAMYSVGLPVYLEGMFGTERGPAVMGVMLGAMSAAGVIATALWGWKGEKLSRRWVFTTAFVVAGLRFFVLMTLPPLWGLLAMYILVGIASAPYNPIMASTLYERIPAHMRGRVFGILNGGITATMSLGVLLTGVLLENMGIQTMLLLFGVVYALATLSLILNPVAQEMNIKEAEDAPTEPSAQAV